MKFLFINGVNLNMTGRREKGVYGSLTLDRINSLIANHFKGDECVFYQSNIEGELCSRLHAAADEGFDGIILNAGAFTHYSYAIRDAIVYPSSKCTCPTFTRARSSGTPRLFPPCAGG